MGYASHPRLALPKGGEETKYAFQMTSYSEALPRAARASLFLIFDH